MAVQQFDMTKLFVDKGMLPSKGTFHNFLRQTTLANANVGVLV